MKSHRGSRVVASVSLVAVLLTGCAGEDDGNEAASVTQATPVASPTPTEAPTPGEAEAAGSRFCKLAAAQARSLPKLIGTALSASRNKARFAKLFAKIKKQNKRLAAAAPREIKADVAVVLKATEDYIAALEKADFDPSKLPHEASEKLASPKVRAAGQRESAYLRDECGIQLGASS